MNINVFLGVIADVTKIVVAIGNIATVILVVEKLVKRFNDDKKK